MALATCSKTISPESRGKYNEYTPKERAGMLRYAPGKASGHLPAFRL